MRGFASARALPWTAEFLTSDDRDIQNWGASLLDQLLFRDVVEAEGAKPYIQMVKQHPNPDVRRMGDLIGEYLQGK